ANPGGGAPQDHAALLQQQQDAGDQEWPDDGQDGQMRAHRSRSLDSLPSTWSLPLSARPRMASTRITAVMAKEITMAVSTSACGTGSTWLARVGPPDPRRIGGLPGTRRPEATMSRFVA